MDFNFTLNENEEKIVSAYGVLALHSIQQSANKDYKIKDLKLGDFHQEILDTCKTRPLGIALDLSREYISKEK